MKWIPEDVKPKVERNEDWMTESIPVLCLISYTEENDDDKEIEYKSYLVCRFYTFQNGKSEWKPETEGLTVSTMPSADWSIETADNFKVLEWTEFLDGR